MLIPQDKIKKYSIITQRRLAILEATYDEIGTAEEGIDFNTFCVTSYLRANLFPGIQEDRAFFDISFSQFQTIATELSLLDRIGGNTWKEIQADYQSRLGTARPNGAVAHHAGNIAFCLIVPCLRYMRAPDLYGYTPKDMSEINPEELAKFLTIAEEAERFLLEYGTTT